MTGPLRSILQVRAAGQVHEGDVCSADLALPAEVSTFEGLRYRTVVRTRSPTCQYFGWLGSTLSIQSRIPPLRFRTFLNP